MTSTDTSKHAAHAALAEDGEAARKRQQREKELRDFVFDQLRNAQREPIAHEAATEVDPATKFARRVRQRRILA